MSYIINAQGIPTLSNWASADHHERGVTPIRGSTTKPLGARHKHHITQIRREADDTIVCRLHATDLVTYYKGGRVKLLHGGWNTRSTVAVMNAVLGHSLRVRLVKGDVVLYHTGTRTHWIIPQGGLMLEAGTRLPINPVPCVIHHIDRKGAKQARQLYAAFTKHVIAMCKLVGDRGTQLHGQQNAVLPKREALGDYEVWGAAAAAFVAVSTRLHYNFDTGQRVYTTSPTRAKRHIEGQVYRRHRDTVLTATTLPLGEHRTDPHRKYF